MYHPLHMLCPLHMIYSSMMYAPLYSMYASLYIAYSAQDYVQIVTHHVLASVMTL